MTGSTSRMCEVMYRRAIADDADVLSASATVYYEDKKNLVPLFDQYVRENLDPQVKAHAFDLLDEPRALALEVVAWTKLYKRSFLLAHDLQFEDGLNSYEDVCFHVFCLIKAERISVIDDPLIYYRQNRPGQISGRTNRKVFEVFEVFRRIHAKLLRWDVPDEIWEQVIRLELRQYDWLLSDRVRPSDKPEFIAAAADQLRQVPQSAWRRVRARRRAGNGETSMLAKGLAARLRARERPYLVAVPADVPAVPGSTAAATAGGYRHALGVAANETRAVLRSAGGRILARVRAEEQVQIRLRQGRGVERVARPSRADRNAGWSTFARSRTRFFSSPTGRANRASRTRSGAPSMTITCPRPPCCARATSSWTWGPISASGRSTSRRSFRS